VARGGVLCGKPVGSPARNGRANRNADVRRKNARSVDRTSTEGSEKASQNKEALTWLARDRAISLFRDEEGEACALIKLPGRRRIVEVQSKEFKDWLRALAWYELKWVPSGDPLRASIGTLEAIAKMEGPRYPLHVRCACRGEHIWIDLDGSRAIRASTEGWEIDNKPPILFRSFPDQKALPVPEKPDKGDVRQILRFVNLADDGTQLLLLCYLVVALVPGIPIPALVVHGVQGSAKTTLLRLIKRTIDPSVVDLRAGVKDEDEFALAASQTRLLYLDNVTLLPGWLSDAICRATTGAGHAKRKLYTNKESTLIRYRCACGISGINPASGKQDLLDRALMLSLNGIPPDTRRPEEDLIAEFDEVRPSILGGLLDSLVHALRVKPSLELAELPRMADFAMYGAAAAVALGRRAQDFLDAYQGNVRRQHEAAIDASPVGQTVEEFMSDRTSWQGSPAELLEYLTASAEGLKIRTNGKGWPGNPSWLMRRLKEVETTLTASGITIHRTHDGQQRLVTLRRD